MENPIKEYAWGHPEYIPGLLNIEWPVGRPAAEVWMGAHPSAPSSIVDKGQSTALDQWIDADSAAALGEARNFGRLPFLFKLLAAGKALSIQAHPNKLQAEEGFARENEAGLPLNSPARNYKDDNHKPEILMAITPFTAMSGFCHPAEIAARFKQLCGQYVEDYFDKSILASLDKGAPKALNEFLAKLLTMPETRRKALIYRTTSIDWESLPGKWIPRLARQFSSDAGILAPLFLNIVQLEPGQAIFQAPGVLHAYLEGFGVELMANSDNVLRGGLTPKKIDVPELLRILDYNWNPPAIIEARSEAGSLNWFSTPAQEFMLGTGNVDAGRGKSLQFSAKDGPLIVLNLDGCIELNDGQETLTLNSGQSAFIPYSAPQIMVQGTGRLALAKTG